MPNSHSTMMTRPSLGHRSISEQAPLYDPFANPHSGSRLRGSKAASGAQTSTGSQLPYSPLLPLPPASSSSEIPTLFTQMADGEQTENVAPHHLLGHHHGPLGPSTLATRRQARRGVSEGFAFHSHQMKPTRTAMAPSPASALGPKTALRLDIAAASDLSAQPAACKSAGMIRSYSLPVATQEEHEEQQRIMALGLSPVGRYAANPAWWQYGWPSPGGVNHRHLHRPGPPAPEFLGERRRSSQSKLSTVMTPVAAGPSPMSCSPATSRPSSRSSKTHSSCSPKMKNKHLPSIHQHTFHNSSSRSASASPKTGRSPLSMISINLPAVDQQQEHASSSDDDEDKSVETPAEDAFDIEMDALNQRFAEWSRSQAMSASTEPQSDSVDEVDEDYFNLAHDEPSSVPYLRAGGGGSDTSDEARTPRASSPRPLSKAALYHHNHATSMQSSHVEENRWSENFDFIHPDHLA